MRRPPTESCRDPRPRPRPPGYHEDILSRDGRRAKVLSARSLMQPVSGPAGNAVRVPADIKVESLAPLLSDPDKDVIILDVQGQEIGAIARHIVVDIMMGLGKN